MPDQLNLENQRGDRMDRCAEAVRGLAAARGCGGQVRYRGQVLIEID